MKIKNKFQFVSIIMILLLIVFTVVPAKSQAASQSTINLGTTATFAILAGSTITNTGTTIINGSVGADIGLSPGTGFTGQESVSVSGGAIHLTDAVALQAKNDLVIAYDDADSRQPVTRIPSELGGTTLTPGTYDSADGTFKITGILTLDAGGDPDGVFVFKMESTLITASDSYIVPINNARFCRTFWKVGSSATLGTDSHFFGHIFAMESITAKHGATIQGQLLARTGAVTLDNNTITNGICEAVQSPTPIPTAALPTSTPIPTTALPTSAPIPTTALPTSAPIPTTALPTSTPIPTSALPTSAPIPTTALPTSTPIPTAALPTSAPILTPTGAPILTPTSAPTLTPAGVPATTPTNIPAPTLIPVSTSVPAPSSIPTPTSTIVFIPTNSPALTPISEEELTDNNSPKTGYFPTEVLYGIGTLLTGTAFSAMALYRRKKKH